MACDSIHVALMSGSGAQIPASIDRPLNYVKLQAPKALQTGLAVLRDSRGRILDEQKTLGEAGVRPGDSLNLEVRPASWPAARVFCCHHGRWICCHLESSASFAAEGGAAEERAAHPGYRLCCCGHSAQWICGHLG